MDYPLVPNLPELIQRNLSTLRYNIHRMKKETTPEFVAWYRKEAEFCIREHNRLVREHRRAHNAIAGMRRFA